MDQADIPEIDIKVESIDISATTRKLKARWSPEVQQDINTYSILVDKKYFVNEQLGLPFDGIKPKAWHFGAENKLAAEMSDYIGEEIDAEIMKNLVKHTT